LADEVEDLLRRYLPEMLRPVAFIRIAQAAD
jgi:hypothetical protein